MDQTVRTPQQDVSTTMRVSSGQPAGDATIRPSDSKKVSGGDVEFMLKGRIYQSIKCLSDNSGEAQVFLVRGEEGDRVLKIYYPNFTIKRTLMRIIQNIGMEMIVKIDDFGKTYVDGKNRDYELMEYLRGGTLNHYDGILP